jgi:hypothetical protein
MEAIKVFLCGGPGSGKTVFLAALYKSLSVADKRLGLRCETSASARALLSSIHNKLRRAWPLGTELREQHEIPFNFYLDNDDRDTFLATRVTFYDYSGEAISPGGALDDNLSERMEEIKELADECDVVISVLDGRLIYESIHENEGEPVPELLDLIDATLQFWTDSKARDMNRRQNHYFIITKWDMFEDSDETLSLVRDMVLDVPAVDSYLDRLDENAIVRIIPVSAVGKGFAKPIDGGKTMEIISKKLSSPINVDIPVASLLPDLVNAEIERSHAELNEAAYRESQRKIPWWKKLAKFVGDAISQSPTLRRLVNDLGIHHDEIDRISEMLKSPMLKTEAQRDAKIAALAAEASSQREAAAILHNHFDTIRSRFEMNYPSSLIQG